MCDGVNDFRASLLKTAYVRRFGRFDARACRYVQQAIKRVDKEVSTLDMEVRRLKGYGVRIW